MKKWKIDWENDTGPEDDSYTEWFTVSNETTTFTCDTMREASWLCDILNAQTTKP